jgi:hypothetical protein
LTACDSADSQQIVFRLISQSRLKKIASLYL